MNKEELEDKIEYSKKYLENRYNHTGDYDLKYSLKTIIDLQQENKQLKEEIQELKADYGTKAQVERDMLRIEASAKETVCNESQQRIEKTITGIDILMEIIKEQPTENALDDIYILDKLNEFKKLLKGDSNDR